MWLIAVVAVTTAAADSSIPFRLEGRPIAHEPLALYALPARPVFVALDGDKKNYRIEYAGGASSVRNGVLSLIAPASPRMAPATVTHVGSGRSMKIAVFAMVPAEEITDGSLDGYRIGTYPATPLRDNPVYLPPKGFVKITEADAAVKISPSFSLGEFACKQTDDFPKYAVLNPRLALKLEHILDELRAAGTRVEKFTIMSGYRTPYYNKAIGNVPYSRHVYGDAADVYIDENPRDDVMDDLNGDGRADLADARWLADFIDRLERDGKLDGLIGGLAAYAANAAHGPFVHVDTRGESARW